MNNRILALFVISLSLIPLLAQAESIYRWVDDEGVTHFTAHPPKNRQSESVHTQTGHSEPVDYSSQYSGRAGSDNSQAQSEGSDSERLSQQELDEACQTARQNLEVLERGGRIAIETDDGSPRYLDSDEREERAETARQIMENAC